MLIGLITVISSLISRQFWRQSFGCRLIRGLCHTAILSQPVSTAWVDLGSRDGPKFGRRRSSAEGFGRMFGSVRLGNMWLFGRSSAELRQTFGVICSFAFAAFCARRWR